jgi:Mg2+/Co2+ transporter CorB
MKRGSTTTALKYTILIVMFAAVISESIGLLILYHTQTPYSSLVLLDAALIAILLIPVLYFFVYRPLATYIKKIDRLNHEKDKTIEELKSAFDEIKTLRGIIPICASCKKVRDDK